MSAAEQSAEGDLLDSVRAGYERRGFRVIVEPSKADVPAFLGQHRPDAVALGPEGGVIIEVKRDGGRTNRASLGTLARLVEQHPGWTLEVIYVRERPDEAQKLSPSSRAEIARQIDEAEALLAETHLHAALVIGWAALESQLRAATSMEDGSVQRPFSPAQLVERPAMDGFVDTASARRLRAISAVRNAVVHGDFSAPIADADVSWLLAQARGLSSGRAP